MMGTMARSRGGKHGSRVRERALVRAGSLGVLVGLTACTAAGPPAPVSDEGERVALSVTTAKGAQQLSAADRAAAEGAVGAVLSRYLVGGFLGDYPRERFVQALDDFTPRAAALAARDLDVVTNARVGDATEVVPRRLDARLSLLVRDGDVIGATAYVDVDLEATMPDGETRDVTLDGRLLLQEQRGRWSVFGFDVANDDGAPLDGGGAG
jgi:hypothetical protein